MKPALVVLLLTLAGCDRGPSPSPSPSPSAPQAPTATQGAPSTPSASPTTAAHGHEHEAPGTPGRSSAGGLSFRVGEPFVSRRPSNPMRAAEFVVPGEENETQLVVFFFGRDSSGTVDENVERWTRQYEPPAGVERSSSTNVRRVTLAHAEATLVDTHGTLAAALPGGPGPSEPKPDQRLIGAIVEGRDGLVFFKLTGSITAVERVRQPFEAMLQSIE